MASNRLVIPFFLAASAGFVLSIPFVGGCSPADKEIGSSNASSSGAGGSAGGTMASSSGSGGAAIECTNHTTLDETNCSLIKQNCPEPGEVCIPNGAATACVYQTGVKGVGASCVENKECAKGLLCVFYACAPICCPDQPAATCGSAECNVAVPSGNKDEVLACNLSKTCTLFGNDCPENQQCRLGNTTDEVSFCAPDSGLPVPEGGACIYLNDCGANQTCSTDVCRYTCSLADWQSKAPGAGGCPPMQMCSPVSTNYGVCGP